ncbi:MAG: hypothetical protein AB7G35_01930 [Hyphomicrobiaceae bacterium]
MTGLDGFRSQVKNRLYLYRSKDIKRSIVKLLKTTNAEQINQTPVQIRTGIANLFDVTSSRFRALAAA